MATTISLNSLHPLIVIKGHENVVQSAPKKKQSSRFQHLLKRLTKDQFAEIVNLFLFICQKNSSYFPLFLQRYSSKKLENNSLNFCGYCCYLNRGTNMKSIMHELVISIKVNKFSKICI